MTKSTQEASNLKKLPLHAQLEAFGGRFGAFGEWLVPLYFTSVLAEHETVRKRVGVFDVSHMGELEVRGSDARRVVDRWMTNDLRKLSPGRALYSPVCRENGGIVDDVIVFERSPERYLIVVNAGNRQKDLAWFQAHLEGEASVEDKSSEIALLAVQGPKSRQVVGSLFDIDLDSLSYYHFATLETSYGEILLSETGYTGEEGYEIFCPVSEVARLWQRLFEVGTPHGLQPIGFGARDTLRLESRFLLYGHDITDETTPLEAGLNWTIGWSKDEFIGKDSLAKQKSKGVARRLVGFRLRERGIARESCVIHADGKQVGYVTSGTYSPTLKKSIGLAYVASEHADVDQLIEIDIRGRHAKAEIVSTPFYKRKK